ncbi:hypothetical protein PR003_g16467 [Phytophthora rubi]|uniref:Secreted protein n=1 Tax=Phytophthora rubi TaxID=129364 RepID=A0A6A4EYU8_9STRA|nr:hypothetical protein PR002_g15859 [Phytophthora rubi]KAE9014974.1 hypothetical protein PR001_g15005 [Phytophthora rubi]KAE9325507.1 hypothetical protein PR003_g16467 [Phytophthora rubi]
MNWQGCPRIRLLCVGSCCVIHAVQASVERQKSLNSGPRMLFALTKQQCLLTRDGRVFRYYNIMGNKHYTSMPTGGTSGATSSQGT